MTLSPIPTRADRHRQRVEAIQQMLANEPATFGRLCVELVEWDDDTALFPTEETLARTLEAMIDAGEVVIIGRAGVTDGWLYDLPDGGGEGEAA